MWLIIFGSVLLAAVAGIVFLWTRFCRFGIVDLIAKDSKWKRRLCGLIPMALIGVFLSNDTINTMTVVVHMAFWWVIAELIGMMVCRILRKVKSSPVEHETGSSDDAAPKQRKYRPYYIGIAVLCVELCYFTAGWYLDHNVWEKDYKLTTEKNIGGDKLRIALFSDSHIGTTFDGEGFAKHIKDIQKKKPDLLVISGDFVDDATKKADMLRSCRALKEFHSRYGVYYVYGNHDKGYSHYGEFTAEDLEDALRKAGVVILEDDVHPVEDKFNIVGRKDAGYLDRLDAKELMSRLDPSKYAIVLDHQPNDYECEAATEADLVLSGHTHGGQMIEMGLISALFGINDRNYGIETRDNTTFIVTSGLSDWELMFKTGCRSEYVIIDVNKDSEK